MIEIPIKVATVADAGAIAKARLGPAEEIIPLRNRIEGYIQGTYSPGEALDPRIVFIAYSDGELAGYIAGHLTTRFECDGELEWLYVDPAHRGTGLADRLFECLKNWFLEQDAKKICVDVVPQNLVARKFYARHGARNLNRAWMIFDSMR